MPTGEQVRDYFLALSLGEIDPNVPARDAVILPGVKGAINGILSKAVGGDANRKLVLKYLADTTTSTALDDGQWYALYCLVRPYKDTALGWTSDNPKFTQAIGAILADMVKQDGQLEMDIE